jgi:Uma2 family endonuclease
MTTESSARQATRSDPDPTTEPFTRADYAQLPEGFRAILLDGQLVREPAPTFGHQAVVGALYLAVAAVARDRTLVAPADVVIDDLNVLQPDVLVFGQEVESAATADPESVPVFVAEVLSPRTARRDRNVKTAAYLRAGVAEVWLVDPDALTLDVVTRDGVRRHEADEVVRSAAVPGLEVTPRDLVRRRSR